MYDSGESQPDTNTLLLLRFNKLPIADECGISVSEEGLVPVVSDGKFKSCGQFGKGVLILDRSWYANLLATRFFTIDFWICPDTTSESALFGSSKAGDGDNTCGTLFLYTYNSIGIAFHTGNLGNIISTGRFPEVGKWSHIAVVCNNGSITIFLNGVAIGSGNMSSYSLPSYDLRLGGANRRTGDPLYSIKAKIDEFRVSDIARWTSNFTPPTKPY